MRKRTIAIVWVVFALCTTFAFAHESSEPVGFELEQSFYSNYCPDIADDYKLLEKEYRELSEDAHSKSFYFNLSLDEYLVYRNSNIDIDYSIFYANDEIEIETEEIARSGEDAFYYNTGYNCPEQATYTSYNLLWNLYRGDIFIEDDETFNGYVGHAGIVEGTFYDASNNKYYIRVVESIRRGVKRGIICDTRVNDKNLRLYRVNSATEDQADSAASFAVSQLGKPWLLHEYCNNYASHLTWYCSELVWAGYYNAGINIFPDAFTLNYVMPFSLEASPYLNSITI